MRDLLAILVGFLLRVVQELAGRTKASVAWRQEALVVEAEPDDQVRAKVRDRARKAEKRR